MSGSIACRTPIKVQICNTSVLRSAEAAPFFTGSTGSGSVCPTLHGPSMKVDESCVAAMVAICYVKSLSQAMRVAVPLSSSWWSWWVLVSFSGFLLRKSDNITPQGSELVSEIVWMVIKAGEAYIPGTGKCMLMGIYCSVLGRGGADQPLYT